VSITTNPSQAPTPTALAGGTAGDTSRLSNRDNLKKAGQQFEAVFVGMMMKSMRQAKLGDGLFDSKGEDTFREMQDQQIAKAITEHAPLGIGKAMTDFLSKSQANLQAPAAPATGVDAATGAQAGDLP
jgi:peptidoglycan hydrolase FlgJ